MVERLVLHIGDHKTGTTALQLALAEGRVESHGPRFFYEAKLNHNALATPLGRRKDLDLARRRFRRTAKRYAASDAEVGILSAEDFEGVPPELVQRLLARHFPDLIETVQIVAYVRPHAERFVSSYAEVIKVGRFAGTMAEFHTRTLKNRRFFYHARFEAWRATFGECFTLRPMIRDRLRGGDAIDDFMGVALGGAAVTVTPGAHVNPSAPMGDLALLRALHASSDNVPDALSHALGWRLADHLGAGGLGPKPAFDRALAEDLVQTYTDDAAAMDAAFFEDTPLSDTLAAAPDRAALETPPIAAEAYYEADMLRLIEALAQLTAELRAAAPEPLRTALRAKRVGD